MMQSLKTSDRTAEKPSPAVKLLLITMVDTTWRAFVPTLGGTFFGILLDHTFHTVPWWTTIMISLGFITSAWLVILQLRDVRNK
jgi:F0F1-type ATP synthase assembly protein I